MYKFNIKELIGSKILSAANDLKRTKDTLCNELKVPIEKIEKIILGKLELDELLIFCKKMSSYYPISLSDIWIEQPESETPIFVFTSIKSKESQRIFKRHNINGLSDYYEYRDTACTTLAPFYPEWIMPLIISKDSNPESNLIVYNKGHLLHQQTFFIGEVNFYWKDEFGSYCREMNTGDSNYITPYVPHSFSSRNKEKPGLIIAVTFSSKVSRSSKELSFISKDFIDSISGDIRSKETILIARIKFLLQSQFKTFEGLKFYVKKKTNANLKLSFKNILKDENQNIRLFVSNFLNIDENILFDSKVEYKNIIISQKINSSIFFWPSENNKKYELYRLAESQLDVGLAGFHLKIIANPSKNDFIEHYMFEYMYNFSIFSIKLKLDDNNIQIINPGDSIVINPGVKFQYIKLQDSDEPELLIVRVLGNIDSNMLKEYSTFAKIGKDRVFKEIGSWF